jgi:hypothetical protein
LAITTVFDLGRSDTPLLVTVEAVVFLLLARPAALPTRTFAVSAVLGAVALAVGLAVDLTTASGWLRTVLAATYVVATLLALLALIGGWT